MQRLSFRTRKHGSRNQVGKRFPVLEKKKLPAKISMPTFSNKATGISNVTYTAPSLDKDGLVSFNFGSDLIQAVVKLIPREQSIGQWDINNPIVYIDNKVPMIWQKSLSIHEALERHLEKKYGIPWQSGGHLVADDVEKRLFLQSRPLKEWNQYSRTVRFLSEMNRTGGKTGSNKKALKNAYAMVERAQKQTYGSVERGLDNYTNQAINLRKAIDKKLRET